MNLDEIETGLFELAEVTQDLLLAAELGQRTATAELKTQLQTILDLLRGSNCHISVFKQRRIVRPDGTQATVEHELADYCFFDEKSDAPHYYCEVSPSLVIDGRRGHPIPSKGDVRIRIIHVPPDDDDGEETPDIPCHDRGDRFPGEDRPGEDKNFDDLLKRMGFDPEEMG